MIKLYHFKDDGKIPNSKYPLVIYKSVLPKDASMIEKIFESHRWSNSWRDGIYSYHHFHSIAHEVLGVYQGSALLHLGGEKGQRVQVNMGDVIIIPAGVGHKCLESTDDFKVVGAYAGGRDWDIMKGLPEEREAALKNIKNVPEPEMDPFSGEQVGIVVYWNLKK